jgi:hypothetical protein
LGQAIFNAGLGIDRPTSANAATAAAAAGGTIENQTNAALHVVVAAIHLTAIQVESLTIRIQHVLVFPNVQAHPDAHVMQIYNTLKGQNIPGLKPVKISEIAQAGVGLPTKAAVSGAVAAIANTLPFTPATKAARVNQIANYVAGEFFPPVPVVGAPQAAADIGQPIGGTQNQRILDIRATVAAHRALVIAAVNGNLEAKGVLDALTPEFGGGGNDTALEAAYAVLTSPPGTPANNKRRRATDMLGDQIQAIRVQGDLKNGINGNPPPLP